jgi:hypothetical protein
MNAITPPTAEDEASLFSLATEYIEAATILEATPTLNLNVSMVAYYLAGHASELLLKSFLFTQGVPLKHLKQQYGHNLGKLAAEARAKGLSPTLALEHVERLAEQYTPKYMEYRQLTASSYPPLDLLISQVKALEKQVFHHITSFPGEVKP